MERVAKYAVPIVALPFLLVIAALVAFRFLAAADPPPSAVGAWASTGPAGGRLELLEGGRLGPSVVPAVACRSRESLIADDPVEVTGGTWGEGYDADAGYLVTVRFGQPERCVLTFASRVSDDGGHTLALGSLDVSWTLARP
ncbi:hypothetical protein ABTX81_15360 [Kitasatospora sp. NPDC097605]|uniref:hypothetical protein n=1 Tax=Kitasatospora sp. NPDC097605 TaxID=3157226 RepID=UPI00332A55A5